MKIKATRSKHTHEKMCVKNLKSHRYKRALSYFNTSFNGTLFILRFLLVVRSFAPFIENEKWTNKSACTHHIISVVKCVSGECVNSASEMCTNLLFNGSKLN